MKKHDIIRGAAVCVTAALAATSSTALTLPDDAAKLFRERSEAPENAALRDLLVSRPLAGDTLDALTFLYAYMSLPDMADYSPGFYLANIESSLKAREEMPWGRTVPDREWRHFVLPVRVNNENLDMSRPAFYAELKDRVKGLSMAEAILEVNHWCHEKVTYKPSDARTSSPLSSVSQAIGRCGEESTFAVAALRSVGIPARQIYTPRWAHTDDNHAWVEVWADGKWHFIGACEPEPVLDLAWFNAHASRGMMMNTNVFGNYDGPEEVLARTPETTRINITSNYAPVREVEAVALNPDGTPAAGADVSFCIYNYAEYYPVATRKTGDDGRASLTAGKGDMMIWATDGRRFGMAKAPAGAARAVPVTLQDIPASASPLAFDIVPPSENPTMPFVSEAMRKENNRRFAIEDSIRNAYTATFTSREKAMETARGLGLPAEILADVLVDSRGNHARIVAMLESFDPQKRPRALDLLRAVSEKDRRDMDMAVLVDHLDNTPAKADGMDEETYRDYVLNARVENEGLTPCRGELSKILAAVPADEKRDAGRLARWVGKSVSLSTEGNPQSLRMSPAGVWKGRKTDALGRSIFYVQCARTLGMPARVNAVTGKTQWLDTSGRWIEADFGDNAILAKKEAMDPGMLKLEFTPDRFNVDPKYYSSFSISRIEEGRARQLEYPENATWSSTFSRGVALDPGDYILTTGQRLADGTVLASSRTFRINSGETSAVPMEIRSDDNALQVIGSLDAETLYRDIAAGEDKSILSTTGRGYYVLGLISSGHEPSAHAINDISQVRDAVEKTGRRFMLLFADADEAARFDRSHFRDIPGNVTFGIDTDAKIRRQIEESLHLKSPGNPVFVIADSFNRIVYVSTGYTIGLGETLLRNLRILTSN